MEGAPASGDDFVWDNGTAGTTNHSIERSRGGFGGLPAGTYTVQIQWKVTHANQGDFTLDDWHLTVERSQVG